MKTVRTVLVLGALLVVPGAAAAAQATPAADPADTMPAAVVQRFVDAANARDAEAMAALVAPDAAFERFPDGPVLAAGRDGIRSFYEGILARLSTGFRVTIETRIVEGNLVVDRESFAGTPAEQGHATWVYQVQGGLIHRAWDLDSRPSSAP